MLSKNQTYQFFASLGPACGALGVQLVAFAVTARGLGASAFGAYSVILATCAICGELVGVGSADLLVRAVARDPSRLGRYFGNMIGMIALTFAPMTAIAYCVVQSQHAETISPWLILIAIVGEIGVVRISTSVELIMVAHHHVLRASTVRFFTPVARLVAALVYFHMSSRLDGWAIAVFIQSALISTVLLVITIVLYGRPRAALLTDELGQGLAFAVPQLSRAIQSNFDRVALASFVTPGALGAYSAGSRVLQLGLFPLQVMTRILYPHFFIEGAKGVAAARSFALGKLPLMTGVGTAAMVAVAAAGELAPMILGKSYAASNHTALVLSLALPLMAIQYLAGDVLSGSGHQRLRATVHFVMALVSSMILAAGAALAGVQGVLIAFVASQGLVALVMWGVVLRAE